MLFKEIYLQWYSCSIYCTLKFSSSPKNENSIHVFTTTWIGSNRKIGITSKYVIQNCGATLRWFLPNQRWFRCYNSTQLWPCLSRNAERHWNRCYIIPLKFLKTYKIGLNPSFHADSYWCINFKASEAEINIILNKYNEIMSLN